MSRLTPRAATAGVLAALALAAPAAARDYAGTSLNIVPSGQPGGAPVPAGADEQARMYDGLTPLFDKVTNDDLGRFFKSGKFGIGPDGPGRVEETPREGLTITRDRFNVPHIKGESRADVVWGMGWVLFEDRSLLLGQARNAARLAAIDAPNIDAFGLVTSLKQYTPTKQVDRIIRRTQLRALKGAGREGRAILREIDLFVAGANARRVAESSTQPKYTRVDIFGAIALAGQIFGQGGGREASNAVFYDGLRDRLGGAAANTLFDDLSNQNDADSPVSISKRFPQGRRGQSRSGNAVLDAGSLQLVRPAGMRAAQRMLPATASNFLIVNGKRSTNGHPLFVGGPQIGYYYPGLTLEADVEWPGHQVRGIYSPAHPGNIFIGRGEDFAWSLTSAGTDNIDTFVETLCGGSDTKYRYKGKCRKMGRVDAGVIAGEGRLVYRTTVHGPVTGYATVNGKRVALSRKRSSFGKDVLWQRGFRRANLGQVRSARGLFKAFRDSPYTFNVGYADDRRIAMFSAGRLPIRDRRVDPRLPTKGTGKYEWKGFLKPKRHAQQIGHPQGALVNWNNRPARAWGSADDQWSYGSAQRVEMLNAQLNRRRVHDLASVTASMNAAATQDFRSFKLTPRLSKLLRGGPAPSARAQRMLELLEQWNAQGSSNLDRDEDGVVDAGAPPAIMYELYPRLVRAVMGDALGPQFEEFEDLVGNFESDFNGFSGQAITHLDKILGTQTGQKFKQPYRTRFCGNGDVNACRTAVWNAIEETGRALEQQQGSADPNTWKAESERIRFAPGLLQRTIRWTNRPSGIQVLATFTGHRPSR